MKKIGFLPGLAVMALALLLLGAGGADRGENDGRIRVAMSLAAASDYYIGTMIGQAVRAAFEEAGAEVQVLDAGNNISTQINQIQNAVIGGNNIIYVFPAGDGATYFEVLQMARRSGVRTLVSNNYPGPGGADVYVGNDEFLMGVMMSAMLSEWVDRTYPNARPGEVNVLITESTFNTNMIRRALGMRLVGERFLRRANTATIYYIRENGPPITYLDSNGNVVPVDEPTGGLILDSNGRAQLNPYFNPKVNIIEFGNRNNAGTEAIEAQNALENVLTLGYSNIHAVMNLGSVGGAVESRARELIQAGRITTPVQNFAVFCSDLTETQRTLILRSPTNESLLRGVFASGDLIGTLQNFARMMVNGETPPAFTMEPLSFTTANESGTGLRTVYYTQLPQLPDTELFFGR